MPSIESEVIRPYRGDEIPALLEMRRAMTLELDGEDLDVVYPGWRTRFATFIGELANAGRTTFFVAERDGRPVAMGGVYVLRNHRSEIYGQPSAYVTSVYVPRELRRRGIARRITQAAVEWARERGCVVVRLRASSTGRKVYQTLGFTPTDEMELRLEQSTAGPTERKLL